MVWSGMRCAIGAILLIGLASGAAVAASETPSAPAAEPATITFTFKPPVPLTYSEQSVTRTSRVSPGLDEPEELATLTSTNSIAREGDGYTIVAAPKSFQVIQGGKPVKDPLLDAYQTAKLTYHLDSAGKITSIEGYGGVLDAVKKLAPKGMEQQLSQILNEKALVDREKGQWNIRIGQFLGQTAHKNSVWIANSYFPLPDSEPRFYVVTLFDGMVKQDGKELAKLKFLFTTDCERIQTQVNDMARDVVPNVPVPAALPQTPGFSISGKGERLVDPSTMLIYSEKYQRDVQVQMPVSKDQFVPVIIHETRELVDTYPGAK